MTDKSDEIITKALKLEETRDADHYTRTLRMEYTFIPITPELVAKVGLIEDPEVRELLQMFILKNSQVLYSAYTFDENLLADIVPGIVDAVKTDILTSGVGRLAQEFKDRLLVKALSFKDHL